MCRGPSMHTLAELCGWLDNAIVEVVVYVTIIITQLNSHKV